MTRPTGPPRGAPQRRCPALFLAAGLATIAAAELPARRTAPVFGGPSVLLSYVDRASPYTGRRALRRPRDLHRLPARHRRAGAGRARGARLRADQRPLPGRAGPNDVLIDGLGVGRVVFNFFIDSQRWQLPVAGRAHGLRHREGTGYRGAGAGDVGTAIWPRQLIRPLPVAPRATGRCVGEPIDVVGAPLWPNLAEAFLRVSRCRIEGDRADGDRAHLALVRCAVQPLSRHAAGQLGIAGDLDDRPRRSSAWSTPRRRSAPPRPRARSTSRASPPPTGAHSRPETTYFTPLAGIHRCFDLRAPVRYPAPGCPLDPGGEPAAMPRLHRAGEPALRTQPIGPVRRTWNVTVVAAASRSTATPSSAAAGRLPDHRSYSAPIRMATTTVIDVPLPSSEGFAFLCIVGTAIGDGEGDVREHPDDGRGAHRPDAAAPARADHDQRDRGRVARDVLRPSDRRWRFTSTRPARRPRRAATIRPATGWSRRP